MEKMAPPLANLSKYTIDKSLKLVDDLPTKNISGSSDFKTCTVEKI